MALHKFNATVSLVVFLSIIWQTESNVLPKSEESKSNSDLCQNVSDTCCSLRGIDGTEPVRSDKKCVFREGNGESIDGECLPHNQCSNGSIITDGRTIFDIKVPGKNARLPNEMARTDTICASKPNEPILTPTGEHSNCGQRMANGLENTLTETSANQSQFGEFPWTAAVLLTETFSTGDKLLLFHCGGSLIHPSVVLTAANCVDRSTPDSLNIRLGEWDVRSR